MSEPSPESPEMRAQSRGLGPETLHSEQAVRGGAETVQRETRGSRGRGADAGGKPGELSGQISAPLESGVTGEGRLPSPEQRQSLVF